MITSNPRRTIAKGSCICRLGFLAVCRQVPSGPRDSGFSSGPAQVGRAGRRTGGGGGGGLGQLAISFAAEGREWPARLLQLSSISDFSPSPSKMPNLLGLTHGLPYGGGVEAVLALLALAAVWVISRRSALTIGAGGGHWRLVGKSSRLRIRCRAVAAGMRAGPAAAGSQGSAVWGAPAVRPDSLRAADARARGLGGGAAKHQWFWHVVIGATGVPWFESIRADTARGARCGGGRRSQVPLSLAEFRKIA